jgi:EmrB/QacA subfamily drug resistance transporter
MTLSTSTLRDQARADARRRAGAAVPDPAEARPPEPAAPRSAAPAAAAAAIDHALVRSIMIGLMLAMFLSALEQTIVAPALPTIGRSLNDLDGISWVVTAYLLSATAVTPLFGKLSDIYGRRIILLIAIGIFVVGSVACALAPTLLTLTLARALQGVGGGGILPLSQIVIADLLSPMERPRYQSYTSIIFVAASIAGPVAGGLLTDQLHWSLIFWINVPIGVAALWMTERALRRLPRHERPHRLDFLGATLMVAAAIALMLALTWGGTRYPWGSAPILSLVAASALLWIAFACRLTLAPEPFIPLTILRDGVVRAITSAGFFSIGTIIGLSIYLPLYLQLVLGLSPSGSGLALISFMGGACVGSFVAGRLLARLKRYRRVPMVGLLLGIAMLAVLAARPSGLSLMEIVALLALGSTGLGTMYVVTTVLMQNAVPLHQLGTATGTLNFSRLLGGAIIVAVFGAFLLGGLDPTAATQAHPAGADHAGEFRLVFLAAAVFLFAALVSVMLVHERPLRGRGGAPME